jgi:Flp pilus assembly protein CpaB
MTYRIRNIGIALALALVAGLLTIFYVTNQKRSVIDAESDVTVWVAARDIPAGTGGTELAEESFLEEQEVAKKSVAPGAISDPDQIADRVSASTIYAGEQITTRRFTSDAEKGVRAQITGNQRAVQVSGTEHQLLAGTLKAGDHVDVLGNWNVPEEKTRHYTRVVLRNLLVLQAPSSVQTSEKLTKPGAGGLSTMLALTDGQAEKLFWITQNGDWSLQLRPTDDAADSPETAQSAESLLLDGFKANQLKAIANAAAQLANGKD